ncbi:MAG: DUF285 domain-containing protein, partial [Proteobacteria bacterium]|nr:DUF285 domain-containing protein [Pseudomonadota bacterium]
MPHAETADEPYIFVCREDGRCAPDSFITVWVISEDDKTLTLPVDGSNYDIDWGDGKQSLCSDDEICGLTHEYTSAGEYTVIIKGKTFSYGYFSQKEEQINEVTKENPKLIEVKAFGPAKFSSEFVFAYSKIVKLSQIDIPNANDLNGYHMFDGATFFNQPLDKWDTSYVTNMGNMFKDADGFNQPLDKWNTSNVKNMSGMFQNAIFFNQPLNNWDTSHVTNMGSMFNYAASFNQPINSWDTSNVTNMN